MNRRASPKRRQADRKHQLQRVQSLFEQGIALHREGDRPGAKRLYEQVLVLTPRHAEARHLLGFAEFQLGRFPTAIEHLQEAVALRPDNGEFRNNLALALLANGNAAAALEHAGRAQELGHTDAHGFLHVGWEFARQKQCALAESAYRLAHSLMPDSAEPWNYLGALLSEQRRNEEALWCYQQAIALAPDYVEAWNNLGNLYRDTGEPNQAIPMYERALQHDPRFFLARNNLGVAYLQSGQVAAAIACFQAVLQQEPASAEALNNLGNALGEAGRLEESLQYYRRALQSDPRSAKILANLGARHWHLGECHAGLACLRQAVMLQPDSVPIHQQLTLALMESGEFDAALACGRHLVHLDPQQPLLQLRAASLCPRVFASREEMAGYLAGFEAALREGAQRSFPVELAHLSDQAPPFPYNMQFLDGDLRPWKQAFAALFERSIDTNRFAGWIDTWRGPRTRPRIGFIVTEGHEGIFLKTLQGIIDRLAPSWELLVLCSERGRERVRRELKRADLQVIPLPQRCDHAALRIAEQRCDLLYYYEIGTDPTNYFLAMLRLAPVQVTSWGVQLTSGMKNVDGYLSSALMEPPGGESAYTERLACTRTMLTWRERSRLSAHGASRDGFPLPAAAHWYVCAQQIGKIHVDFDEWLAGILRRDPAGIVVLTGDIYGHYTRRLRTRLDQTIPDVAPRVHLLPRLDQAAYLNLLRQADVLLDPPYFAGGNSTYDGLALGQPIVCCPSLQQRGRYTLGCYQQMQFGELVTHSPDEYIGLAVRLATEPDYRHDVAKRIRVAAEVLFEDSVVVAEHERIFWEFLEAASRR